MVNGHIEDYHESKNITLSPIKKVRKNQFEVMVMRSDFNNNNKYYPQGFLINVFIN